MNCRRIISTCGWCPLLLLAVGLWWAGSLLAQESEPDNPPITKRQTLPMPDDGWIYGDPLISTSPENFNPRDRHDERPTRSDDEQAALAEQLRDAYSKPIAEWPPPRLLHDDPFVEMGPVQPATYPDDNPHSEAKAELGQLLFFDGRLSGSGQMSCNSCHIAELGWSDGRARALGHGAHQLRRNTPTLLNAGKSEEQFWDGRADSIEQLIKAVLTNDTEMNTTARQVEENLSAVEGYAPYFTQAFGDPKVTVDRVAQAIATHVRGVVSEPSADFDRFLNGDHDRLDDSAVRGLHLFRTDANCISCHHGPLLRDERYHNLGLVYFGRKHEDRGRYLVTNNPEDVGKFKTPSLRNVSRTAPYTHTGFFDLPGLINLYNAGGARPKPREHVKDDPLWPETSDLLMPLHLNEQDKADLLAFLESLTERRRRDLLPELPE